MERGSRRAWRVLVLASFIAYALAAHFLLRDSLSAALVSGLTHAAAYLALLWYFGRTLYRGREPLITRLARSVHGTLPPQIEAFTRRVTVAWCLFFGAQVLGSALLFALAPFEIWSAFVNLLNLPLLILMFVGDHLYQAIRFPDHPRPSIARVLRAFAEVTSDRESTKAI